eukprot:8554015-Alexandrium_andersonii.AAC.1
MSASLVGSEMCIRDRRAQRCPAQTPGVSTTPRCPPAHGTGTATAPLRCPCLLYTSDAADDM